MITNVFESYMDAIRFKLKFRNKSYYKNLAQYESEHVQWMNAAKKGDPSVNHAYFSSIRNVIFDPILAAHAPFDYAYESIDQADSADIHNSAGSNPPNISLYSGPIGLSFFGALFQAIAGYGPPSTIYGGNPNDVLSAYRVIVEKNYPHKLQLVAAIIANTNKKIAKIDPGPEQLRSKKILHYTLEAYDLINIAVT